MSAAVARVAFASDAAGGQGGKGDRVAAAIDAAFGRLGKDSACWLVIGGDEYTPFCTAKTVLHYDKFFDQEHISPKRTVMTPGNHSNGPGGKYPDARAWLAYNAGAGHPDPNRRWLDRNRRASR